MQLTLKWGGVKYIDGWKDNPEIVKLIEEYDEMNKSRPMFGGERPERQKEILCELIDLVDDPDGIYLDWDGIWIDKQAAKDYVLNYGKE